MKSKIEFEHGETTCAYAKGEFCMFLKPKGFGRDPHCSLFQVTLYVDENYWLERSAECMEVFGPESTTEV